MENLIFRESGKRSMACFTRRCFLLAMCLTALTRICFAQDIIVTVDSKTESRIRAKVTEVTADEIKYKNYDNQDGPVYSLPKSVVSAIIYENGNVETFFEFEAPKIEQPAQDNVKIEPTIGPDIRQSKPVNIVEDMKKRDPDLYSKYAAGKKTKTTGGVITGAGIAALVGGGVVFGLGMTWDDDEFTKGGAIIAAAGAVITGVGVPVMIKGGKKKKSAINEYTNQYYSSHLSSPHFQFNLSLNRAGLAFVF